MSNKLNNDSDFLSPPNIVIDNELNKLNAIILCGGLGTRLGSISAETHKSLLKIGDKEFIDILIDNLLTYGIRNFILCTGYKKEQIREHFENNENKIHYGYSIQFSEENRPLDTGGTLQNAREMISGDNDNFLVLNGDSYCKTDFKELYDFHVDKSALMTMVLGCVTENWKDYGNVILDSNQRITGFIEKSDISNGYGNNQLNLINNKKQLKLSVDRYEKINAGIYIFNKQIFSYTDKFPDKFSLENEFFPDIIKTNRCYGFVTKNTIIDIGTPERYKSAVDYFATRTKS